MSNPSELLFDTSALVDLYRGRKPLRRHFDSILSGEELAYISVITEAELWRGMRLEELERHELMLDQFVSLPIDSEVACLAGTWMQRYEADGLGWMDALIVATASFAELKVLTRDRKLAQVLAAEAGFEIYGH